MDETKSLNNPAMRSVLESLRDFETALLANTLGYLDATPPELWYVSGSIRSVTPSIGPTVGVAMTCRLDSSTPGQSGDIEPFWAQLQAMLDLGLPTVWVVQCVGSRPEHECVIGDGMAKLLVAAGCVGLVTDGGVRDIRGLHTTGLATYCKGTVIHHGPLHFSHPNEPVQIGGIEIKSGDIIHADSEGVIKLPEVCLQSLPEAAVRMRAAESETHMDWRRTDLSIAQKRAVAGRVFDKYGFSKPFANDMEPK